MPSAESRSKPSTKPLREDGRHISMMPTKNLNLPVQAVQKPFFILGKTEKGRFNPGFKKPGARGIAYRINAPEAHKSG